MRTAPEISDSPRVTARAAIAVFLILAFSYFTGSLVRGVTATLAPRFTAELGPDAGDPMAATVPGLARVVLSHRGLDVAVDASHRAFRAA